jgi:hypothetical protein
MVRGNGIVDDQYSIHVAETGSRTSRETSEENEIQHPARRQAVGERVAKPALLGASRDPQV